MTLTLTVLSGLHRGAEIDISPSLSGGIAVTLGSDALHTDITLLDPGILPVHCRFSAEKNGLLLCENNGSEPLRQGANIVIPGNYIAYGRTFNCAGTELHVKHKTAMPFSRRKIIFIFAVITLIIPAIYFIAARIQLPAPSAGDILSGAPYRCLSREIKDAQWIIRGFVSKESKNKLISYLKQQDIAYQLNGITPDTELEKLNMWLTSLPNNHLTAVLSASCGYIDIQGIRAPHQQDISLADRIPKMLISSKILIDDRSIISDDYIKNTDAQINTLFVKDDIVSYTFSENAITFTLNRKADEVLIKKLSAIVDNFNNKFKFSYQINIIQQDNKPAIRISAVSLGKIPYIITDKGAKYRVGSAPDKDTQIISIDKEKMVLLYKNKYYTITYTDDKKQ